MINTTNYKTNKKPVRMDYLDDIDIAEFREIPTYKRIYIKAQNISAWCVFEKRTGQILQFGWDRIQDLRKIVQCLLARYPSITVKNIDSIEQQLLDMLESLSFRIVAKQYEMVCCFSDDRN